MKKSVYTTIVFALLATFPASLIARSFPDSLLPAHITAVTNSGERPDWSHDGQRILFVGKGAGSVYEVEVATKKVRLIAKASTNLDYYRALYLSNGDYFLTGGASRGAAYAHILDKGLQRAPVKINTIIKEGPAISRTSLKICYVSSSPWDIIWKSDIVYTNGVPSFKNTTLLIPK